MLQHKGFPSILLALKETRIGYNVQQGLVDEKATKMYRSGKLSKHKHEHEASTTPSGLGFQTDVTRAMTDHKYPFSPSIRAIYGSGTQAISLSVNISRGLKRMPMTTSCPKNPRKKNATVAKYILPRSVNCCLTALDLWIAMSSITEIFCQ